MEPCPHCGHVPRSKLVETICQFREDELERLIVNGMLTEAVKRGSIKAPPFDLPSDRMVVQPNEPSKDRPGEIIAGVIKEIEEERFPETFESFLKQGGEVAIKMEEHSNKALIGFKLNGTCSMPIPFYLNGDPKIDIVEVYTWIR